MNDFIIENGKNVGRRRFAISEEFFNFLSIIFYFLSNHFRFLILCKKLLCEHNAKGRSNHRELNPKILVKLSHHATATATATATAVTPATAATISTTDLYLCFIFYSMPKLNARQSELECCLCQKRII